MFWGDIMQDDNRLGTESVGKLMLKLTIPSVLAQLVNLLYNIVDRIYVGRIPGIGAMCLAGLGVTFPIILLISAVAMLFGMGGASRASVAIGEKDIPKAEKILGNCTMLLIVCSVILSVLFYFTKDFILLKFGASENTLPYASEYISIYLIGTIFVQITMGLNLFITNQGFSKTSMITVCIGAVLNIALDPLFIFAFDMGVKGAAAATVISQGVSCVWVLRFLTGKKTGLKIRFKNMVPDKKIIKSVVSLGISPFVMQATECLIQLTFNNGMLKYGNDMYVALMSILFSLMQLIWMPVQGFAQGAQPITGYNYGARNMDRVRKTFKLLFTVSLTFSILSIAIVEAVPQLFLGLFTNDTELIMLGKNATRVYLMGMALMGAQSACQQTFLALGQAKISMFLACLRKVILLLPLAIILPYIGGIGVWGLFIAEPISDIIAVVTTTTMFAIYSKRILK